MTEKNAKKRVSLYFAALDHFFEKNTENHKFFFETCLSHYLPNDLTVTGPRAKEHVEPGIPPRGAARRWALTCGSKIK